MSCPVCPVMGLTLEGNVPNGVISTPAGMDASLPFTFFCLHVSAMGAMGAVNLLPAGTAAFFLRGFPTRYDLFPSLQVRQLHLFLVLGHSSPHPSLTQIQLVHSSEVVSSWIEASFSPGAHEGGNGGAK